MSAARWAGLVLLLSVGGCIGSRVSYSPRDDMLTLLRYNHFLPLGPCGGPWNYDHETFILLPRGADRADAAELEVYDDDGRMTVSSGSVALDRSASRVRIHLILAAPQQSPEASRWNGVHRYAIHDPGECEATRDSVRTPATTAPATRAGRDSHPGSSCDPGLRFAQTPASPANVGSGRPVEFAALRSRLAVAWKSKRMREKSKAAAM
jgi:hypothetical protein